MRIDLLRHGMSEASHSNGDEARRLTPEGAEAIRRLGVRLAGEGWRPDRAYSSPLARALATAKLVLEAAGVPLAATVREELKPDEDAETTATVLEPVADGVRHLLLVAHQPLLGELVLHWTGRDVALSPGELVTLEFQASPGPRTGTLADRIKPR